MSQNIILGAVLAVASIGVVSTVALWSPVVAVALLGLLVFAGGVVWAVRQQFLWSLLSLCFVPRIALILVDSRVGLLPVPPIVSGHNHRAILVANAWRSGDFLRYVTEFGSMRRLVAHALAPFYILFGNSMLAGRVGVASFSILVGYLVYRMTLQFATKQRALMATALTLMWPSVLARSIIIQRETILMAALLAFLLTLVKWIDENSWRMAPVAVVSLVAIYMLREENLLLLFAAVVVALLVKGSQARRYLGFAVIFAVPASLYLVANSGLLLPHNTGFTVEALNRFAHARAHGDAAYLVNLWYKNWFDIVLYLPIKVCYLLFSPFPWQVHGLVKWFAGISGWGLLAAIVLSRGGTIRAANSSKAVFALLAFLVVGVAAYAIIEMNYAAAFRRRVQFVPLILIFATVALPEVRIRIRDSTGDTNSGDALAEK
ncbi:MAG: glycosyltransferase family 39 protein [Halorientalis sp.]